jgi:hypothetical protein
MSTAVILFLLYALVPLAVVLAAGLLARIRLLRQSLLEPVLVGLATTGTGVELAVLAYFARLGPFGG